HRPRQHERKEDRVEDGQVVGCQDGTAGGRYVLGAGHLGSPQSAQERPGHNPGKLVLHPSPSDGPADRPSGYPIRPVTVESAEPETAGPDPAAASSESGT